MSSPSKQVARALLARHSKGKPSKRRTTERTASSLGHTYVTVELVDRSGQAVQQLRESFPGPVSVQRLAAYQPGRVLRMHTPEGPPVGPDTVLYPGNHVLTLPLRSHRPPLRPLPVPRSSRSASSRRRTRRRRRA